MVDMKSLRKQQPQCNIQMDDRVEEPGSGPCLASTSAVKRSISISMRLHSPRKEGWSLVTDVLSSEVDTDGHADITAWYAVCRINMPSFAPYLSALFEMASSWSDRLCGLVEFLATDP
jgi:hypothetical protein